MNILKQPSDEELHILKTLNKEPRPPGNTQQEIEHS